MEAQIQAIATNLGNIFNVLNSAFGGVVWYKDPEWLSVLFTFLAFVVLCRYAFDTYRMANATKETMLETLRPIVSCSLVSGKNRYSKEEIQNNPKCKTDTMCIVTNHSKYNVEVFVNLNLKIDGKPEIYNDEYSGKKAWPITSFQQINGHFDLTNKFNLSNVKSVTIDLEVSYRSDTGKLYKNPTQYWHLDLKNYLWVNDIGIRA